MHFDNEVVQATELPELPIEAFRPHPLSYRRLRMISTVVAFLPLLIGAGVVTFMAEAMVGIGVSAFLLLLLSWVLYAEWRSFPLRGYLLRDHDISYSKGWIYQSRVSVPFNRIQHSEVSQGPIGRYMGLSRLKIFTAGGSSSDLSIGGLEEAEAQRLREFIIEKTAAHV